MLLLVQQPHFGARTDRDTKVEPQDAHSVAELARASVRRVGQNDGARNLVVHRARDELKCQVRLRLEREVYGHSCLLTPRRILGPRRGHVERKVDGQMFVPCGDC
jgi:hypothetical protein